MTEQILSANVQNILDIPHFLTKNDQIVFLIGCKALLKEENINVAVRKGDLYGFMIEHYVKAHNHKQAYALILELRQEIPNVNLAYYVNTDVLLTIEKALGVILQVDTASKFSGEEPIEDD